MASSRKSRNSRAINLVSRMEKTPSMSLKDIKKFAASHPKDFEVNGRNKHGKTALMFACGSRNTKLVAFLLDQGADPNSQCECGNSPMHFAVFDTCCCSITEFTRAYSLVPGTIERKVDILRLLIDHGATQMCNSKGLDPCCLAAMCKQSDLVNFFLQRNTRYMQLSDEEQIRALEILGVTVILAEDYPLDGDVESAYTYFSRAKSIRKKISSASSEERRKSIFSNGFSIFSGMEVDFEEWKSSQFDKWDKITQAFLIAERTLPEDIIMDYFVPKLLLHARSGVFHYRRDIEMKALQIFKDAVQLEQQSKLKLGSVIGCILEGLRGVNVRFWKNCDVKECISIMNSCLPIFESAPRRIVRKTQEELLKCLGLDLILIALSSCPESTETFELLLTFAEQFVKTIRKKCEGRNVTSVSHDVIVRCRNYLQYRRVRVNDTKLNRLKRLISRLVQCEDATHQNIDRNTMLHSLMKMHQSVHPQFLKDVALVLIRNGCDPKKRNNRHKTLEEMINYLPNTLTSDFKDLKEIITSQSHSVLPLEEIAARTILRHHITHEGVLPKNLSRIVTGDLWPPDSPKSDLEGDRERNEDGDLDSDYDIDLECEPESDSEYDSDMYFDSDSDSDLFFHSMGRCYCYEGSSSEFYD
ncbi:protein fem-1 homolog C-like [Lytechinus variegatus]|uniref:protein fem-1 homolog C-like n=1 Tax=Lytechinus variegatus TaxID=7654 RepID=UPI001BB14E1D|nr:protein fem-1 homolog C-like [Lytechinus variegatus]